MPNHIKKTQEQNKTKAKPKPESTLAVVRIINAMNKTVLTTVTTGRNDCA